MKKNDTVNKSDLIILIANKTGVPRDSVEKCLDAFVSITTSELSKNHDVRITGFGSFHNVPFKEREVNSSAFDGTDQNKTIGPRVVPRFRASQGMKDKINKKLYQG